MKKLITISFLFSINLLLANNFMCLDRDMKFLPKHREISVNSMFIIEGYALSQNTINSFKKRKVFLENSKKNKIELELIEILIGDKELTQAIFKPKSKLEKNTIYNLKYYNQTDNETKEMIRWNSKSGKKEKVFWKTSDFENINLLNEKLKIEFHTTNVTLYGCGPSVNAIFKIKNNTSQEAWYRVEVIDLITKSKKHYIITSKKNNIYVGHGMCSGAFTFKGKSKYKARFTPMNIDGKMNKPTNWFFFNSPYSKNKGF